MFEVGWAAVNVDGGQRWGRRRVRERLWASGGQATICVAGGEQEFALRPSLLLSFSYRSGIQPALHYITFFNMINSFTITNSWEQMFLIEK